MASSQPRRKTVLITGKPSSPHQDPLLIPGNTRCSRGGIGNALALEFYARGFHTIASARSKSTLSDLEVLGIDTISLEVTSVESIEAAKKEIEGLTGGELDILVNNAGRNYTVPALDITLPEVRATFETNLFSIMALTQTFIPLLIPAQGLILNIGSVAAIAPYVFGAVYNASKAALHAYSRTLRLELEPFGVRVLVVVTGGVKSRIARTSRVLPEGSLYLEVNEHYQHRLTHSQEGAMDAHVYAKGVVDAALAGKTPRTLWRGNKAWLVWFVRQWLGSWAFDWVLPGMFGLDKLKALVRSRGRA